MGLLELIATAWLAGTVVTYLTVSAGLSRDEGERFLATRLYVAVTWPLLLGFVAWWSLTHAWRRIRAGRHTNNGSRRA